MLSVHFPRLVSSMRLAGVVVQEPFGTVAVVGCCTRWRWRGGPSQDLSTTLIKVPLITVTHAEPPLRYLLTTLCYPSHFSSNSPVAVD